MKTPLDEIIVGCVEMDAPKPDDPVFETRPQLEGGSAVGDEVIHTRKSVIDPKAMIVEMTGSVEVRDRYDSMIFIGDNPYGRGVILDSYRLNPVILWNHGRATSGLGGGGGDIPTNLPIGRALAVIKHLQVEPRTLDFRVQFSPDNPLGSLVYRLVKTDIVNASSVGFKPLKTKHAETKEERDIMGGASLAYGEWDLLELSFVGIPGNQLAIKKSLCYALALKEFTAADLRLLESVKDENLFPALTRAYGELHDLGEVVSAHGKDTTIVVKVDIEGLEDVEALVQDLEQPSLEELETDWKQGQELEKLMNSSAAAEQELVQLLRMVPVPAAGASAPAAPALDPDLEGVVSRLLDVSKLF